MKAYEHESDNLRNYPAVCDGIVKLKITKNRAVERLIFLIALIARLIILIAC